MSPNTPTSLSVEVMVPKPWRKWTFPLSVILESGPSWAGNKAGLGLKEEVTGPGPSLGGLKEGVPVVGPAGSQPPAMCMVLGRMYHGLHPPEELYPPTALPPPQQWKKLGMTFWMGGGWRPHPEVGEDAVPGQSRQLALESFPTWPHQSLVTPPEK